MNKLFSIAIVSLLASCSGEDFESELDEFGYEYDIESIRGAVLSSYPQTTVGRALENWSQCSNLSFWFTDETANGTKYVNFNCFYDVSSYVNEQAAIWEGRGGDVDNVVQTMCNFTLNLYSQHLASEAKRNCSEITLEAFKMIRIMPRPILEIQFQLNLDDTFNFTTSNLYNSLGYILLPQFDNTVLDKVYANNTYDDQINQLVAFLTATN